MEITEIDCFSTANRELVYTWQRRTMKKLEDVLSNLPQNDKRKLVSSFAIAILNYFTGNTLRTELWDTKKFIKNRTSLGYDILDDVFKVKHLPQVLTRELLFEEHLSEIDFTLKYDYSDGFTDQITLKLPHSRGYQLLKNYTQKQVADLIQRYNFLSPTLGFFWSIQPNVYQLLSEKTEDCVEVIEGFASPLNNNLALYCSAFEEDQEFGSLGNFFQEIQTRGMDDPPEDKKSYRRWIINPPYTNYIFEKVLIAVSNRMNDFPRDVFYFLLPDWENVKLNETIRSRGIAINMPSSSYFLYDHIAQAPLSPPVNMLFGVLMSTPVTQCTLLERAVEMSRVRCGRWNSKSVLQT